jgi:hypothetical protein
MINRRNALSALAGIAAMPCLADAGATTDDPPPVKGAFKLKMGHPLEILARSNPVKGKDRDAYVITIEKVTFDVAGDSRLTAKLFTMIVQMAQVDYWISAAVYDAKGKLHGAASHMEAVKRVMLGRVVMATRDITLDFGISKGFARAAFATVVVGERDVPIP